MPAGTANSAERTAGAVAGPERGAQNARSGVLTLTPNGSYALVITPAARSWQ